MARLFRQADLWVRGALGVSLGMLAMGLLAGCDVATPDADKLDSTQTVLIRYATHYPAHSPLAEADKAFAERVHEASNGRVEIRFYWDGVLGGRDEILTLLSMAAVEVSSIQTGQYPSHLKYVGIFNSLPLVWDDGSVLTRVARTVSTEEEAAKAEYSRNKIVRLFSRNLPHYRLACSRPLNSLEDFKGLKVRSYGRYVPHMWLALGAIPVNVHFSDMYESLARGNLDCAYLPYFALRDTGLYQAAPYLSDLSFGMIEGVPIFVSETEWLRWPEEVRSLMSAAALEVEQISMAGVEAEDEQALQDMLAKGASLIEFDDEMAFHDSVPDMLDLWVELNSSGGDGSAASYVRRIRAELALLQDGSGP